MNVIIYVNKAKDPTGAWLDKCKLILQNEQIDYKVITDKDLKNSDSGDALFVLGGDGTILNLTEYASKNHIPIIGINAGKLGFLTEFERYDMQEAITLLKKGKLVKDKRETVKCTVGDKTYFALNDVVLQRIKIEERGNNVASFSIEIDDISVEKIIGDGVIVSTPTGSTAYSISAGGSILAPNINVFSLTPIAAHSLNQRPIVYSSKSICVLKVLGVCKTGLFIDGIFVEELSKGQQVVLEKSEYTITFLRKKGFNFYRRLSLKLKDRTVDK